MTHMLIKHMLKVWQPATATALYNQPRGNRYLPAAPELDGKQHQRLSQYLH
jgi:hypothetical protein